MSESRMLTSVTTGACAVVGIPFGLLVGWLPALLGAGGIALLLYGLAGFMWWMDR